METRGAVREQYADYVSYEGQGCFNEWARGVLDDPEVLAWLATLPEGKQQPNLVFAAARWHGVSAPGPYADLRDALLGDDGTIRSTILGRATQTNEVGRLATLLPAIAAVADGGPVSLLEVGASAGLCLYPDRWDYEWVVDGVERRLSTGSPGVLRCQVTGAPLLPASVPTIAWRGGVDLHPLDVLDDDQMAWLRTLVWPEHDDRRALLSRAVEVARAEPPRIVAGDLLTELPALVEEARAHAPVVVFHSAVVAYLDSPGRERFHDLMTGLVAAGACHWVSNEGKRVLPRVTATGPPVPDELATFVLGVDGRAVAWTHGHGRTMTWF